MSGSATIRGKIDGSDPLVEDEAEVAVRVALVPVAALFPRAGERHRGAGTAGFHPDATAYWVDPRAVARVLLLQTLWEHLTRSPSHPNGTYLSFNDLSLPWGGLFDDPGNWERPHNSHRLGTSADLNNRSKGPFDVDTQMQVTTPAPGAVADPTATDGIRVDLSLFNTVCRRSGGYLIPRDNFHCEWRGQL